MNEKGIATPIIIGIVVAAIVIGIGASYFLILKQPGPSGGPSEEQEGGAEEMGIPVYSGAEETQLSSAVRTDFGVSEDIPLAGYTTGSNPEDVKDWYKNNMSGWTLKSEDNILAQGGSTAYIQHYKKGSDGAFIFVGTNPQEKTVIGIASGSWTKIQECGPSQEGGGEGEGEGEGEEGTGEEGAEAVDWSEAHVFTDPKGDFWLGEGSPPQVIEYPPSDIIRTYITNDNQYLYFKFEVGGIIRTMPHTHNGDNVRILTLTCVIDSDQNKSTGDIMNYPGGDIALDAFLGSPPEAGGAFYSFVDYYLYDPSAEEGTGEPKSGTLLAGGEGENFITMRVPLSDLNLESGTEVEILPWVEAESDLYHHFARDVLGPEGTWYKFDLGTDYTS